GNDDDSTKSITKKRTTKKRINKRNVVFLKDRRLREQIENKLAKSRKKDEMRLAVSAVFRLQEENNDFPSRRDVMELARCSDYQAKEAIRIAKEIIEDTQRAEAKEV
ncbi:hypothetical protein IC620_16840, partial [Hazenella sp. IB182357]